MIVRWQVALGIGTEDGISPVSYTGYGDTPLEAITELRAQLNRLAAIAQNEAAARTSAVDTARSLLLAYEDAARSGGLPDA